MLVPVPCTAVDHNGRSALRDNGYEAYYPRKADLELFGGPEEARNHFLRLCGIKFNDNLCKPTLGVLLWALVSADTIKGVVPNVAPLPHEVLQAFLKKMQGLKMDESDLAFNELGFLKKYIKALEDATSDQLEKAFTELLETSRSTNITMEPHFCLWAVLAKMWLGDLSEDHCLQAPRTLSQAWSYYEPKDHLMRAYKGKKAGKAMSALRDNYTAMRRPLACGVQKTRKRLAKR